MHVSAADESSIDAFIARWRRSEAAERANLQPLLAELCDLLGVPKPDPKRAGDQRNAYRRITVLDE